jgi:glutamate dehydrogenase
LIVNLEAVGGLNRAQAVLPSKRELVSRTEAGLGLTRPEIATLLAHSKNVVRRDLLASPVPDEPVFAQLLSEYFPPSVRSRFPDRIRAHRLHREIIATQIADQLINHVGPGLIYRLEERLGVTTPQVAQAYGIVAELFDVDALWAGALAVVDPADRNSWGPLHAVQALIERACSWLLRNRPLPLHAEAEIQRYRTTVGHLVHALPPEGADDTVSPVPVLLLGEALALADNALALDIPITRVVETYQELGRELGLFGVSERLERLALGSYWDSMAAAALRDEVAARLHDLVGAALSRHHPGATPSERLSGWRVQHGSTISRLHRIIVEAQAEGGVDLARACTVSAELARAVAAVGYSAPRCVPAP